MNNLPGKSSWLFPHGKLEESCSGKHQRIMCTTMCTANDTKHRTSCIRHLLRRDGL